MTATIPAYELLNRERALEVLGGKTVEGAAWHKGAEIGGVAVAAGFRANGTIIEESVVFQPPVAPGEVIEDSLAHTEAMHSLIMVQSYLGEVAAATGTPDPLRLRLS